MMYRVIILVLLIVSVSSCISNKNMNYVECSTSDYCRVKGIMTIKNVDHIKMGRLELPTGKCINVSLPPVQLNYFSEYGAKVVTVEGQVFPSYIQDETIKKITISGRRIGWSQCGIFYLFVK